MSVELEPATQLAFTKPFAGGGTALLTLRNRSDTPLAFKVKTTAPRQYCVRPNCGNVGPHDEVQVTVLLQPLRPDPPVGTKCRDKFLVQSVHLRRDELEYPSTELWALVDQTRKDQVVEQKLRCVYLESPSAGGDRNGGEQQQQQQQQPSSATSPTSTSTSTTTHPPPYVASHPPLPSVSETTARRDGGVEADDHHHLDEAGGGKGAGTAGTATTTAAAATAKTSSSTSDNSSSKAVPPTGTFEGAYESGSSDAKVKALEQKIAQLEAALASKAKEVSQLTSSSKDGLRQRLAATGGIGGGGSDRAPTVITKTVVNPGYYSPQWVLILTVVSFLAGVLLF